VVIGDATQLHQVFLNLCVNARDAMPEGGTLTIGAENAELDEEAAAKQPEAKPGSYVCLRVSDTGCGMPPQVIEKIFDPFFTTKEPGKGTGLGLSTVAGIVKSHGGFLLVESTPGSGTLFRIFLPAAPKAQAEREEKRSDGPPRGRGERILVVDDEPSIREAAIRTLEAHGYKAYTAEDGTDALALFFQRRSEIQLVLTDIEMDLMDGVALVSALKRLEPQVRVIASTGQGDSAKRMALKQMGVGVYLDKPYTADQLLYTVNHVLTVAEAAEVAE
jgi:CheY-like chemotaxis protein